MKPLLDGYSAKIDGFTRDSWYEVLSGFEDSNIYQTWDYETARRSSGKLSHMVLRKGDRIVAAAQSRIVKLPLLNAGIAYVRWGPLWRSGADQTVASEIFAQALRALRNEYVSRKGLVLRILPVAFNEGGLSVSNLFLEEGFEGLENAKRQWTLLIDLNAKLEDLRKGLDQKWRNCLNRAEKNGLEVLEGVSDELFNEFIRIYWEMHERKGFSESSDINEFRRIQSHLPGQNKMRVFICRQDGRACAGIVCSAMGRTGIYMFGATSNVGMKTNGSYLLQWRAMEWLKGRGCSIYDLHGIDKARNPGTYHFKTGLSGKNGKEVQFLGQFEVSEAVIGRVAVTCGETFRDMMKNMRGFMAAKLRPR